MNIIELSIEKTLRGIKVGCKADGLSLFEEGKDLSTTKRKMKSKIKWLTGFKYNVDYTFQDKVQ